MLHKRSMRLAGHRTSLALEDYFWAGLERLARKRNTTLPKLIEEIDKRRASTPASNGVSIDDSMSLASAVRVYLYEHEVKEREKLEDQVAM